MLNNSTVNTVATRLVFFFTFSSFGNPRVGMMNCQRNLFEELLDRERVCVFVSKNKTKKKNLGLFSHCLAAQISCVLLRAHNASVVLLLFRFL